MLNTLNNICSSQNLLFQTNNWLELFGKWPRKKEVNQEIVGTVGKSLSHVNIDMCWYETMNKSISL